jgi:hypothetical protein
VRIDDDVAEALYSANRMVPTYTKSQITPIKNNYNGATPDPDYISGWNLTLGGLDSGLSVCLDIRKLMNRFSIHEQITRLVCVEGWSAIAWWAGLRFDDLLRAYPPISQARWARVESSVNLTTREIPTLTLSRSTWQRLGIRRRCLHTPQRAGPHGGTWSSTPSLGAGKTWFEECEGHYADYLFRGRAQSLLDSIWIFLLRRNLV